jgi:hypothetical protein
MSLFDKIKGRFNATSVPAPAERLTQQEIDPRTGIATLSPEQKNAYEQAIADAARGLTVLLVNRAQNKQKGQERGVAAFTVIIRPPNMVASTLAGNEMASADAHQQSAELIALISNLTGCQAYRERPHPLVPGISDAVWLVGRDVCQDSFNAMVKGLTDGGAYTNSAHNRARGIEWQRAGDPRFVPILHDCVAAPGKSSRWPYLGYGFLDYDSMGRPSAAVSADMLGQTFEGQQFLKNSGFNQGGKNYESHPVIQGHFIRIYDDGQLREMCAAGQLFIRQPNNEYVRQADGLSFDDVVRAHLWRASVLTKDSAAQVDLEAIRDQTARARAWQMLEVGYKSLGASSSTETVAGLYELRGVGLEAAWRSGFQKSGAGGVNLGMQVGPSQAY